MFGDGADLVEVATEDFGVWDVFGALGELEEDDAGADLEEAHYDCSDGARGAFEATEENCGGDDGGGGEEDVVGGGDEGRVENVECFLYGC